MFLGRSRGRRPPHASGLCGSLPTFLGIHVNRISAVTVRTDHPIAVSSPDHLNPWGTSRDNSRNPRFNEKLYKLYAALERPLRVLDLGCAGGGFVRDCLNDGCLAVGLEGSDFSLRMRRAEWALIGGHFLFTADITKPFTVLVEADGERQPVRFDAITAWDVLEHIGRADLSSVCDNLRDHLAPGGICVFSISHSSDIVRGVELHQTIEGREWWTGFFREQGFRILDDLEHYFNTQFVRGKKQEASYSFHVVLCRDGDQPPAPPDLSLRERILDAWYFSRPHRALRRLVMIR
jgi:SAM-dependent methyltransferase